MHLGICQVYVWACLSEIGGYFFEFRIVPGWGFLVLVATMAKGALSRCKLFLEFHGCQLHICQLHSLIGAPFAHLLQVVRRFLEPAKPWEAAIRYYSCIYIYTYIYIYYIYIFFPLRNACTDTIKWSVCLPVYLPTCLSVCPYVCRQSSLSLQCSLPKKHSRFKVKENLWRESSFLDVSWRGRLLYYLGLTDLSHRRLQWKQPFFMFILFPGYCNIFPMPKFHSLNSRKEEENSSWCIFEICVR